MPWEGAALDEVGSRSFAKELWDDAPFAVAKEEGVSLGSELPRKAGQTQAASNRGKSPKERGFGSGSEVCASAPNLEAPCGRSVELREVRSAQGPI